MRKLTITTLVAGLVMTLLGGLTVQAEKAHLVLTWCCGQEERRQILEETAASYMALHPDVEIEVIYPAGYTPTLKTWIAAGNTPDIFWYGVNWPSAAGVALPMDDFLVKTGLNRSIHPGLLNMLTMDGKTWGVPYGAGTHVIYYNKDTFDRYGMEYPQAGWDWDKALAMSHRLTQDTNGDGTPEQWGLNLEAEYRLHSILYGGDFYTTDKRQARFANPATTAAVQLYANMKSGLERVWGGTFTSGNVAMSSDGAFGLAKARQVGFDWDLITLPVLKVDGAEYRSNFMGPESWLVSKTTQHPDIAQDFVRVLLSEEVMAKWGKSGTSIPSQSRYALQYFAGNAPRGENMAAFVEALDGGHVHPQTHPEGLEIQNALLAEPLWAQMWAATVPASVALPELQKSVNNRLDEYWAKVDSK